MTSNTAHTGFAAWPQPRQLFVLLALLGVMPPVTGKADELGCLVELQDAGCGHSIDHLPNVLPGKVPDYLESFALPGLQGLTYRRVTKPGVFGADRGARHSYSRRQAWNADETLLDLGGGIVDSHGRPVLLEEKLRASSERHWSASDSDQMFAVRNNIIGEDEASGSEFGRFDIETLEWTTLFRTEEFSHCTIGNGEGSVSMSGSRVVLSCKTDASTANHWTLLSLDVDSGQVLGRHEAAANYNWASYTVSGEWIVIENNDHESDLPTSLVRFGPAFDDEFLLSEERAHGDLGLDDEGNDVMVMMEWNRLWFVDVQTGEAVTLGIGSRSEPVGYGHVSCRANQRPGWCALSSYDGALGAFKVGRKTSLYDWGRERLGLGRRGLSVYESWGRHFSLSEAYESQAQVSFSPSGRQMVFTSDWGGQGEPNDYVVSVTDER